MADELYDSDSDKMASDINDFFHSVSGDTPPLDDDILKALDINDYEDTFIIYPWQVQQKLSNICSYKAAGPDGLPNWFLKEMAPFVAEPICAIFNASITHRVPNLWRQVNVIPIPKISPPKSVNSDLRPISLTAALSKILESFVGGWIFNSVSDKLDKTSLAH